MDNLVINLVVYVAMPLVTMVGGYIFKKNETRMEKIETEINLMKDKLNDKVNEATVRQILSDKLDPLHQDLREVRDNVQKLFDLYVSNNRK